MSICRETQKSPHFSGQSLKSLNLQDKFAADLSAAGPKDAFYRSIEIQNEVL
jgi:hypothetical protein